MSLFILRMIDAVLKQLVFECHLRPNTRTGKFEFIDYNHLLKIYAA